MELLTNIRVLTCECSYSHLMEFNDSEQSSPSYIVVCTHTHQKTPISISSIAACDGVIVAFRQCWKGHVLHLLPSRVRCHQEQCLWASDCVFGQHFLTFHEHRVALESTRTVCSWYCAVMWCGTRVVSFMTWRMKTKSVSFYFQMFPRQLTPS